MVLMRCVTRRGVESDQSLMISHSVGMTHKHIILYIIGIGIEDSKGHCPLHTICHFSPDTAADLKEIIDILADRYNYKHAM